MKIDKTKGEVLLELLLSLNNGNCGYSGSKTHKAQQQLKDLEEAGIEFKKEI